MWISSFRLRDLSGVIRGPWYKPLVRRLLGIAVFALLYQMYSTGLSGPSADPSSNNAAVGQAIEETPASTAKLQSQLGAILKAAKDSDTKSFDELTDDLRVPDSANWFTATFGEEMGEKLAATYSRSWNDYKRDVDEMFRDSGTRNHTHAFIEKFSAASLAPRDVFIQSILQNAKGPLVLYTAGAGKYRKSDALPGVYIFAQGSFRVVNWRTFYELPNVEPMRIRVDRRTAPEPIQHVHQASPYDPHHPQLHDTVMVHVIIDRDGVIALAEAVSGPPERYDSAVHVVRQFRYVPQTRNGAPVEIDTIFPVSYAEAEIKLQ